MSSRAANMNADHQQLDIFLSKVLELELATPRRDIRSARYFHGKINRVQTESFLDKTGKFLLRESCTQNGQFVLSANVDGQSLHFIVLKTTESNGKVKFSFEGELFETVRDLVDFHWKSGQPITAVSRAVIHEPVARTLPIDQPRLIEYYQKNKHKTLDQMIAEIFNQKKTSRRLPILEPTNIFFSEFTKLSEAGISVIDIEASGQAADENELLSVDCLDNAERWCEAIASHESSTVASHLFKANLYFVGLNSPEHSSGAPFAIIKSGLELMLLPYGHQMRRDLIVRHSCLKYFVLTTILKANSFRDRLEMLIKWIEVAAEAKDKYGDYFTFGAVMAALVHEILGHVDDLWNELKPINGLAYDKHEHHHKPLFHSLLQGGQPPNESSIAFPFIIQLCHLVEAKFGFNSLVFTQDDLDQLLKPKNEQQSLLVNIELDDLLSHVEYSSRIMTQLDRYEANARLKDGDVFARDAQLETMCKTSHQVHTFFGHLRHRIEPAHLGWRQFQMLEEQISSLV